MPTTSRATTNFYRLGAVARFFVLLTALLLIAGSVAAAPVQPATRPLPKRIVSLGPINTENLFLMGAGDLVVGCTTYCTSPPEARQKEKIGSVLQIDVEKILSLNPDLILATGLTSPQQVEQFQRLGIPVVHFRQPRSFAEICDNFLELGRMTGHQEQAERVISEARRRVESIRRQTAPLPPPKAFLQIGASPLFASIAETFTSDYLTIAGAINIAGQDKRGQYDYERVLAKDPEIILIAIMGEESGIASQEKKKWEGFPVLSAVRAGRVHILDPDLVCSPTPASFIEALELLARLLHPGWQPEEQS